MTCGWCGGSIASANKPHTKGECEMTKVELEWMHAHKKHQEELKALQAKYDALEQATRNTLDLLRTSSPPDAFRFTIADWNAHKVVKASAELAALLDGVK